MTVERMIKELQKCDPKAEVKLHDAHGGENSRALFVLAFNRPEGIVVIEDKSDCYLPEELDARFKNAYDKQIDELDFFMDLLEIGITLNDIKENLPEQYNYSKRFMEEHGLI